MEKSIVCLRCGLVDEYILSYSGPHIKATCSGCGWYIKFVSQADLFCNLKIDIIMKTGENKQDDNLLPGGIRFFNPHEKAPDFVLCTAVISLNELFEYCKKNPQLLADYNGVKQLKIQVLVAKSGKVYGRVDDYKAETVEGRVPKNPNKAGAPKDAGAAELAPPDASDLPF